MGKLEKKCQFTGVALKVPGQLSVMSFQHLETILKWQSNEHNDQSETYDLKNYQPPDLDRREKLIADNNCYWQEC